MFSDRRQFLKSAATAAFAASQLRSTAGLLSTLAPMQGATGALTKPAPALLDRGFATVTKIADRVYATIANVEKGDQCSSNGGVIVGRDATLIVEGHQRPAGAALEIEAARMLSKTSIRGAVNTHFHLDHTFGNIAYAEQHIPIIAHNKVGPLMKEHYARWKGVDQSPLLAPIEKKIAQATDEADKKHKQEELEAWKWMYNEVESTTLAFPTEPLDKAQLPKRIDLGGLTVVIEFHPGHTPTDLIVRVPDREIVFTGDLLFNHSYPVTLDADMIAWRKVLDRFAGYDRRTQFVPGHEAICGLENVREQCTLFDHLRAHAETMIRIGASAEEGERRYAVPKRFEGYHLWWGFSIGPAMRSYYAALAPAASSGTPEGNGRFYGRGGRITDSMQWKA